MVYDDTLMVTGGHDGNGTSDNIREAQVVPPYTVKILSRIPEPRQCHCTEIFDDGLVIIGGTKTGRYRDNLSSVVLYDIKNNVCKQLAPQPYEVSDMATVRWGDNLSVNLSLGFKNEFYPLQRGFRSFVNSAWISRGFCVDTNKCLLRAIKSHVVEQFLL